MLVDEAEIILKGGHGGAGKVSFYKPPMKGPDGGNGGKGGDVYIATVSDLMALRPFTTKRLLCGQNGEDGGSNRKFGKDGEDLEVSMPVGTVLVDLENKKEIELSQVGTKMLVCKGGLGGRGNFEFKSSRVTTPEFAQSGLEGEKKHFKVSLKLIADFGLVGLPNSGKSSLLNELTRAQAKVASYPFTTLEPNLGVLDGKILADIPGLIGGASTGKGLGIKFLKHIEKVGVILHCISSESENVKADYKAVKNELSKYDKVLSGKKEIILLTKSDLVDIKLLGKQLKSLESFGSPTIAVSIYDFDSIENLKKILTKN